MIVVASLLVVAIVSLAFATLIGYRQLRRDVNETRSVHDADLSVTFSLIDAVVAEIYDESRRAEGDVT